MLKPAMMFQNHMVLQRDKKTAVWGTADANALIKVEIQSQCIECTADANGKWMLKTQPLHTSFSETMKISTNDEELVFEDVQIGDVYLAAGQSNMEFFMRYDADLESEKEVCADDAIRFFDYPEVAYPSEIDEADYSKNFGFWRKADAENLQWFSAVAYYFAKEIRKNYDIPVGILACNWGGTPACAWMSREALIEGGGEIWLTEYEEGLKTLDLDAYEAQINANPNFRKTDPFNDIFSDMLMKGYSIVDIIRQLTGQEPDFSQGTMEMQMPAVGPKTETRPCGLYESMLTNCAPYTLKGILYYQGESDGDKHPEIYASVFTALIKEFRSLWHEQLPFLFVQLAPFGTWLACNGEPYVLVREAQQLVSETVANTGMAVITDVGMEYDIHPKKKQPVGYRLSLLARKQIYGENDLLAEAPTLCKAQAENGKLILTFENCGEGLCLKGSTPDGAECRNDQLGGLRVFINHEELDSSLFKAAVCGNTVKLTHLEIVTDSRIDIELACTGWYRVNLYNSSAIPARPAKLTLYSES